MKTTVDFIKLKGVKVPDLNEPKGKKYYDTIYEIKAKVDRKRSERNKAIQATKELQSQLNEINEQNVIRDNTDETYELSESKREIQNNIDYHNVLSDIDFNNYANKLMQDNNIEQLRKDAMKEDQTKKQQGEAYQKELRKIYESINKDINEFTADYKSQSYIGIADRLKTRVGY